MVNYMCFTHAGLKYFAQDQDNLGRLPLHRACMNSLCARSRLTTLIKAYNDGVFSLDKNGALPLHYAAANMDAASVRLLLEYNDAAATTADKDGLYPLNWAIKGDVDPDVVRGRTWVLSAENHQRKLHGRQPITYP